MRTLGTITIIVLLVAVVLVGGGLVAFADPCTTTLSAGSDIQTAINSATAGDVICLDPGLYSPAAKINIDKSITLQGPQAGVDPRPGAGTVRTPGDTLTEAIIDGAAGGLSGIMVIKADNVVLDGLEVRNGSGDMIDSEDGTPTAGTAIRYNIINHATGDEGMQLRNVANGIVEYNHVFDIAQDGINMCCGSTDGIIRHNEVHDNSSENAAIYIYQAIDTTIRCNLVYDVYNNEGIKLGSKGGGDALLSGGSILYNTVHDTGQDGIAVYMSDTLVDGNEVYHSSSENGAIYLAYGISRVTVIENDVHDNTLDTGKWGNPGAIMIGTAVDAANVHVNENNIYGNSPHGVANHATGALDATSNWWGADTGPDAGSTFGDVVSTPFLDAPVTIPDRCSPDDQGPITSNVLADPNPAQVGAEVTLSANVDDTTTGNSNIASAEYSLDGGPWTAMAAADSFDSPVENVTADFNAPATAGIYDLCVRGTDAASNIGPEECIMLVVYDPSGGFVTGGGWIDSPAGAIPPVPTTVWEQGFETGIDGWFTPNRVPSGTNGVPSAAGGYHAEATGDYTRWGGYNSVFPTGGFITSLDVYLDMEAGYANDLRFDWTSAINAPDDNHRRDFIFNGGFYNDDTGPGANLNRFVFSASNNVPGWPKNPGRDPIAVTVTGWYTLQHRFYNGGTGVLAVDLSILDSSGSVVHTWTLSDPTDVIGDTVGGNRYGWFATNEFPYLAIDDVRRVELGGESPTGKATFGFVSKYKKGADTPEGNTEFQFKAADLNFHSTSYDWLVVTGSNFAKFKGVGTINGEGAYKFQVWAGDGDPDTFRIKIWWEDGAGEHVVYDNGMNQAIGGGNIVVHKAKK